MKKLILSAFLLLLSLSKIWAFEYEELQVTVDYDQCLNFANDRLTGVSATSYWKTSKPLLLGVGAGAYYGYSEEISFDLYVSGKYKLKESHSLRPFIQMDLGSANVFTFSEFTIMANPKFGFEYPYNDGNFIGSIGLRFDQLLDLGEAAFCIGFSLGYVF